MLSRTISHYRILETLGRRWSDVALFHDFDGTSSPAHPTALFRWGPLHLPFTAHLDGIGVGPLAGAVVLLRIVHLAALFALQSLSRLHDRSDDFALSNP